MRTSPEQQLLVVLNMSAERQKVTVDLPLDELRLVFSNREREAVVSATDLEVEPFEIFIGAY
jgi:hypothetical protein